MHIKSMQLNKKEINTMIVILLGLVLFIPYFIYDFRQIYLVTRDTLFIHTILEIMSISISMTIFIYGWNIAKMINSKLLLFLSFSFFSVAIFDVMHAFSYEGMPFFSTASEQMSLYFGLAARMSGAIILLCGLFFIKQKNFINTESSFLWFLNIVLIIFIVSYIIVIYNERLPVLFLENQGMTWTKNGLELFIVGIYIIALIIITRKYLSTKNPVYLNLMVASTYIIFCGLLAIPVISGSDDRVIIIHIFKVLGYIYFLKVFYHISIQVPLEKKKQVESKLIDMQSELELLFEKSSDAIVIYQKDLKIIRTNASFHRMFGFNDEIGLTVNSIIPNEYRTEFRGLLDKLDQGLQISNFQTKRVRQDQTLLDISITTSAIVLHGQTLYAAILRDISDQKKAELEMNKARKELQQTLELQSGVVFRVKKIKSRFIHTLVDGNLIRVNNLKPKVIEGKEIGDFMPEEFSPYIEKHYEIAWRGEDITFQLKYDENNVFLINLKPVFDKDEINEIIGTCTDITTAIKTEELLRKSEKLSVVGELAAGFAHEIRNPLTTIKGFLQLVNKNAPQINQEYMSIMLNEIDRLEMITNEFMAVAKPEIVHFQKENIDDLLHRVQRFLEPQALLKGVELILVIETVHPFVYADINQLRQIFINLYKNAMEAMLKGGTITTRVTDDGHYLSIEVIDEGCGIPEHLISRLGEPFYTLKEKGTGLGLMVTKKIIDSHNGYLEIESVENEGTTMKVKLPVMHSDLIKS